MLFELDTKKKIITLKEECSFEELDKIKEMIGPDFKKYKIKSEEVKEYASIKEIIYRDWYPYAHRWWDTSPGTGNPFYVGDTLTVNGTNLAFSNGAESTTLTVGDTDSGTIYTNQSIH